MWEWESPACRKPSPDRSSSNTSKIFSKSVTSMSFVTAWRCDTTRGHSAESWPAHPTCRRGGPRFLSLGILGSFEQSNAVLGKALRDDDLAVRSMAEDALWAIWFRADTPEHNRTLEQVRHSISREQLEQAETLVTRLIADAPNFAEAYNQRAFVYFLQGRFAESAEDCQRVLARNPFHIGAIEGLAKCQLGLNRPRDALKSLRRALKLRPHNTCTRREHPRARNADRVRRAAVTRRMPRDDDARANAIDALRAISDRWHRVHRRSPVHFPARARHLRVAMAAAMTGSAGRRRHRRLPAEHPDEDGADCRRRDGGKTNLPRPKGPRNKRGTRTARRSGINRQRPLL